MASSTASKSAIVIGGGVIGVSSGLELVRRGYAVTIVDAREGAGLETSFANGGLLTASMPDPWNAPGVHKHLFASLFDPSSAMKLRPHVIPGLAFWGLRFLGNASKDRHFAATVANYRLAKVSLDATRALREELGLRYDASDGGTMKVFRDAGALEQSRRFTAQLVPEGLRFETLDRDGAIAAEPQLAAIRDKLVGALKFPDDASGDAYLFTKASADAFVAAGGQFRTGARVERILVENGRATGVAVGGETLGADLIVLAAGNRTPALARPLGISVPIAPAKGYSLTFQPPAAVRPSIPIIDDAMHAGVTPLGDRLRVAGTAEFTGFDTRIDPARVDNLAHLLGEIYPRAAETLDRSTATAWTALRPMSADGRPFIGATKVDGLWINGGHGHLGWTCAVGSARLLADLLEGRPTAIDPTPYRVQR
jgi:D-amino-acid dehydrogenase